MLDKIADILQKQGLVSSTWATEMNTRGQLVKLYRDYYAGLHRLKLTSEMRQMMQISDANPLIDRYNANYAEMVVNTMADRLVVENITPDSTPNPTPDPSPSMERGVNQAEDAAKTWGEALLKGNRFDALQIEVRTAAIRDGETFVMGQFDETTKQVQLYHELAWDGNTGTLAVYDRQGRALLAAVKIWREGDARRVNIYYAGVTIKYILSDTGELSPHPSEPDVQTARRGVIPGIPLVHFINKGTRLAPVSELVNVIPLQDSLNRTLVDMVMSAELSAFSLLFAVGWKPPSGLTPGMILHTQIVGDDGKALVGDSPEWASALASLLGSRKLERIGGGDLGQLIAQADFLITQIGVITSTPVPSMMGGDGQSGEALKQRDIRLLGKLSRAQVSLGNAWEDVMTMAARLQEVQGIERPPAVTGWNTLWKTAEIRNDADILAAADKLHQWGYDRAALRLLAQSSLASFGESDIDQMLAERAQDNGAALGAVASNLPGFEAFNLTPGSSPMMERGVRPTGNGAEKI